MRETIDGVHGQLAVFPQADRDSLPLWTLYRGARIAKQIRKGLVPAGVLMRPRRSGLSAAYPYGWGKSERVRPRVQAAPAVPGRYVELHCHSAFSLREGASLPHELAAAAAETDVKGRGVAGITVA